MQIGPYKLTALTTSTFALDGGAMFGVVPKTLWSKQVEVDELNRISMVTRTLLLESEDRKILIDTGNGDKWQPKLRDMFKIDTNGYILPQSLREHGLQVEDITDVICTHLHFDHVGGNTRLYEDEVVPTFPHARYWVQEENWKLANQPTSKDRASYRNENWQVLAENGMLEIMKSERELFDNIRLEIVNGHTLGQQLPVIYDESRTLIYGADLFPMKPHIPIPWVMAYDNEPLRSMEEKSRLLPQLLEKDAMIFFEHDPSTACCGLVAGEKGIIGGADITEFNAET
ncbi:MAG: MBL fold metallo-hydrolase [Candidatus Marinimicrobia bacterium]|nr:MBL fold metallo-hydrolase [Candidatus Neomarinimicrobiota bacterium]MCF7904541.1 MBL fold metallo-hydrolase [Candidatus Neomarinimicrobiota bacterium]